MVINDPMNRALAMYERTTKKKATSIRLIQDKGNYIYKIDFIVAVRIKKPNPTDDPFYSPDVELRIIEGLLQSGKDGPVPPIWAFEMRRGDKMEAWIPSKGNLHLREANGNFNMPVIYGVVDSIKEMHAVPPSVKQDFRFEQRYYSYKKKAGVSLPEGFERSVLKTAVSSLRNSRQVISHNDLHEGNIILTESCRRAVYFCDFEFAALNGELFDLASLIEENNLDDITELLLTRYLGMNYTPNALYQMKILITALDGLWYYWALGRLQDTADPVFADIAKEKKERFLRAFRESIDQD